jgi:hypothetical protein
LGGCRVGAIFCLILLGLAVLWIVCARRIWNDRAGWFAELYVWLGAMGVAFVYGYLWPPQPESPDAEIIAAVIVLGVVVGGPIAAVIYSYWTCPPDWLKRRRN